MPTFRYNNDGMPDYLRNAARKNLAVADSQVSAFNDRMKYFPLSGQPTTNGQVPETGSAFKYSSIGGAVETSIGAPVSSFQQPTVATTATNGGTANSSNWRFRSFGPSQLPDRSQSNGTVINPASPNLSKPYDNTGNPLSLPLAGQATIPSKKDHEMYGAGSDYGFNE